LIPFLFNYVFCTGAIYSSYPYSDDVPSNSLIDKPIFNFSLSIFIIFALTICPNCNSSSGFTTLLKTVISELCTKPSKPFSISTKAPNGTNFTTLQVTISFRLYFSTKVNHGFSPFNGYSKLIFLSSLLKPFIFTSISSFTLNFSSSF